MAFDGEPEYMVGFPVRPGADTSQRRNDHWDWLRLFPQEIVDGSGVPLEYFRCTISADTLELTCDLAGQNRWLICKAFGPDYHDTNIFYGDDLAIPTDCYPMRFYAQPVD